jgi:hypothetical protein
MFSTRECLVQCNRIYLPFQPCSVSIQAVRFCRSTADRLGALPSGTASHIVSSAAINSIPSHKFCIRRFSLKLC